MAERAAAENELKNSFLSAFAELGQIGKAVLMAGIRRENVTRWQEADPEFASRYKEVIEGRHDTVEAVLYNVATDTEAPHGARVSAAKVYLEANRPETYRPRGNDNARNAPTINLILGIPSKPPDELESGTTRTIDTKAS